MIEFDFHIKNPNHQQYNLLYIKTLKITKAKSLELSLINKSYSWFKIAFAVNKSPYIILGLCKFVICGKIK